MAEIVFYEKPGCITNSRQKMMLADSGHILDTRSIISENWSKTELKKYFSGLCISEWFNRSAPQVKSGELNPDMITEDVALALMLENPLLIRRPLLQVNGQYIAGFNAEVIDAWIGLECNTKDTGGEGCSRVLIDDSTCYKAE